MPNQCFCFKTFRFLTIGLHFDTPSALLIPSLTRATLVTSSAKDAKVDALTNKNLRNLDRLSKKSDALKILFMNISDPDKTKRLYQVILSKDVLQ